MSTKKQLREQRRKHEEERKSGFSLNPPIVFVIFLVVILVIFGLASHFGGSPSDGAVWSPEHQHWH